MHRNPARPMSPHLTIWRWGPHMLVSILHRATGSALSIAGAGIFIWWLLAAASGEQAYSTFLEYAGSWPGMVVLVGLSWALFQHTLSGLRHFVMDIGAGYELRTNKFWAVMTMVGSVALTALFWLAAVGVN